MKLRIKGKDKTFTHETDQEVTTIGRSSENDFVIPLPDFSRKQCIVTIKGDYAFIMDCGSKNGILIDGKKIKPNEQYPIYQHSRILIANYFEFILPDGTAVKEVGLNLEALQPRR